MTITIPRPGGKDLVLARDSECRPCSAICETCIRRNVHWRYLGISAHGNRYYKFSAARTTAW